MQRFILVLSASCAFLLPTVATAEPVAAPIKLFNGKDLSNFYVFLYEPREAPGKPLKPYGKNVDPKKVFTVEDGVIRVSGQDYGGLITEKEYDNYHLITEFKWGEKTWPPRENATRDSGLLLHCLGEPGMNGQWLKSVECNVIEGGTGDIILVSGKNAPEIDAEVEYRKTARGEQAYYKPGAPLKHFTTGRINWTDRDPNWKDVKGFRGEKDVEKPVGEWNTLECICAGDTVTYILNGKVVNRGSKSSHDHGKILFQSEGAEVYFRRVELLPLKK